MKNRRFLWAVLAVCLLLPPLVTTLTAQSERSAGRGPTVVLDGRELPVPVTIGPAGPQVALAPLVDALGGTLTNGESGESSTLKIDQTEIVLGAGSSIITVGETIVSLPQPATRGAGGILVPVEFLRKTYGALQGFSFDWRPEEAKLVISRREAREIKVSVDVVHLQGMTTVVLQFGETPRYHLNQQPGLIEVQMTADRLAPQVKKRLQDDLVQDVSFTPQLVRVQLARDAEAESYVLENPFRLVFDVHHAAVARAPSTPAFAPPPAPLSGIHTIVIDPGHGGTETGAIGPGGVQEKELTLALARELAARLEQRLPGVHTVLTRSEDLTVPLDTRPAIANQNKADLFVSLHLNSSLGAGAHGAETYFLSNQATDTRAARAAAAENVAAPGATEETQDLQLILFDLAQSHHLAESQRLATFIQGELNEALQLKDRGVKQAPFRVLMGAAMPAVLVEFGFISNPDEEAKLQTPTYRTDLIDALVKAIGRYKAQEETLTAPAAPQQPAPLQGATRSKPKEPAVP